MYILHVRRVAMMEAMHSAGTEAWGTSMNILNASYLIYIYPHIFLHIGFDWILMQTLYAFYIHVLHPLGGSPI